MRTIEIRMIVTEDEATVISGALMVGSDDGAELGTECCLEISEEIDEALPDPSRTRVDYTSPAVTRLAQTEAEPPTSSHHLVHAIEQDPHIRTALSRMEF